MHYSDSTLHFQIMGIAKSKESYDVSALQAKIDADNAFGNIHNMSSSPQYAQFVKESSEKDLDILNKGETRKEKIIRAERDKRKSIGNDKRSGISLDTATPNNTPEEENEDVIGSIIAKVKGGPVSDIPETESEEVKRSSIDSDPTAPIQKVIEDFERRIREEREQPEIEVEGQKIIPSIPASEEDNVVSERAIIASVSEVHNFREVSSETHDTEAKQRDERKEHEKPNILDENSVKNNNDLVKEAGNQTEITPTSVQQREGEKDAFAIKLEEEKPEIEVEEKKVISTLAAPEEDELVLERAIIASVSDVHNFEEVSLEEHNTEGKIEDEREQREKINVLDTNSVENNIDHFKEAANQTDISLTSVHQDNGEKNALTGESKEERGVEATDYFAEQFLRKDSIEAGPLGNRKSIKDNLVAEFTSKLDDIGKDRSHFVHEMLQSTPITTACDANKDESPIEAVLNNDAPTSVEFLTCLVLPKKSTEIEVTESSSPGDRVVVVDTANGNNEDALETLLVATEPIEFTESNKSTESSRDDSFRNIQDIMNKDFDKIDPLDSRIITYASQTVVETDNSISYSYAYGSAPSSSAVPSKPDPLDMATTTKSKKPYELKEEKQIVLNTIDEIRSDAEKLRKTAEIFEGRKDDFEYVYLNETLLRCLIKLDSMNVAADEEVHEKRKEAVECVQECIKLIESRADDEEPDIQVAF